MTANTQKFSSKADQYGIKLATTTYLIEFIVNLSSINALGKKCAEGVPRHLFRWQICPSLITDKYIFCYLH